MSEFFGRGPMGGFMGPSGHGAPMHGGHMQGGPVHGGPMQGGPMHGAFFGESPIDRMMGFGHQGGFGSIFDEIEREFLNHQGGMGPPMGP